MLVQWSYFWTSKQLFSKIQIFSTYDFGFFQQVLSFEKLETWLASAFLSKVMSSHGKKLASCSWWQGLPYVDCRKKRGANWVFKVAKLLCKILFHFKPVLSSNSPIVSANSQLKVMWCSFATCWWCKDLKSLALPLEPVLPPWVKSTNEINSLRKKNKLRCVYQRFYCKILM